MLMPMLSMVPMDMLPTALPMPMATMVSLELQPTPLAPLLRPGLPRAFLSGEERGMLMLMPSMVTMAMV